MKNITYFLGAGASYNACPILKAQSEKMIELATILLPKDKCDFSKKKPYDLTEKQDFLWDIGFFGFKGLTYGTIDTYAKKLSLNNSFDELSRLKMAVSIFFTLWQLTDDKHIKSRDRNNSNDSYEEIDRRYINLLAAIIEKKNDTKISIKDNIRFVTWNYDLQLELAYKAFCYNNISWQSLSQNLKFRINERTDSFLQICHLNGYHGFYNTEGKEYSFIDLTESTQLNDILNSIDFISTARQRSQLDFMNHINYAWESNMTSKTIREYAKKIFSTTDILIIIGYSFPNFNKEIDFELFRQLKDRKIIIYYQDPNASESYLAQLIDIKNADCNYERIKLDSFILPYEF